MSDNTKVKSTHWADITADKIIRERGMKDHYTCASGITPSGTVHIGNFREIISVELVVRALRDKGENVRFIYSWDDYDVFRKVPQNMPEQEKLKSYLRKPITLVPDVLGNEESYAAANEKSLEALLPTVGVFPEYIYQAKRYRNSEYAEGIKNALVHQDVIRRQLNESRTSDLPADWMPVSVFCTSCDRDTTKVTGWDGDYGVSFECECGHSETVDLRKTGAVKLPWRIDWPMRWKQEDVDFEPAGKDHHSEGGSFDTARKTGKEVYDHEPPVTFQYDFIRIKGRGGKISSSSGEVISLPDVLEIYQPEIIRYLFAGTRPNTEFAISFDLDVLKIYEDYDKCERTYFSKPETPKALKNWEKQARIYELSQVGEVPVEMPYQMQIRHLCNLLQVHSGDIDAVINSLKDLKASQEERFRQRCACAWGWVKEFAPEDFRYSLRTPDDGTIELDEKNLTAVRRLALLVEKNLESMDEKEFGTNVYDMMKDLDLESADFFTAVYQALISKEKGPRLISFLYILGKEKVLSLLKLY
ncbi:lysine--tRNA ligase [Oceanispirochaeta sp.]|jgi:lysyl-tRNA synthetase class 1|uniref:lysine--tRNA ligase n=1 Tax=Oceanispirochaeta sp. TaxID=2035350 RepID=UPI00260EEBCE|nr:lysine--tRNA ligase [Oceanispirochaeta sp.]MDA3955852.1 lysine--tRNA ligase [Oceanispirochaeta sp.]